MNGDVPNRTPEKVTDPYDLCLWGLNDGDWRTVRDDYLASHIPAEQRCKRCEGTGNEFVFMYRKCQACGGTGISQGNEGGEFHV